MNPSVLNSLRLVVIDPPYSTMALEDGGRLFLQALNLKLSSYKEVYASGVLPVDTYDFVSTHHVICEEGPHGLTPLCVYRLTEYERCLEHRVAFPGIAVLNSSNATHHSQILARMLESWHRQGQKISYGSGYAIAPRLRAQPELRRLLKDLFAACLVHHEQTNLTAHALACGVPKVHTDQFFLGLGYERVSEQGQPLPAFAQASLIGDDAVLLHCQKFNFHALKLAQQYREFWDRRVTIAALEDTRKTNRTAA